MSTSRQSSNDKPGDADAVVLSGEVLERLTGLGYRARIVPIERLRDLEADIEEQRRSGSLDPEVERKHLSDFDFDVTGDHPDTRAVILVAVPQPHLLLSFNYRGQAVPVVIPPIYSTNINNQTEKLLTDLLSPAGYRVFRRPLPLKLLAVRTGLAKYGKNNIAYVEGMGSYCRLLAYCTDLPASHRNWFDLTSLDACEKCTTCLKRCPTGAIVADRFVIHAERCLTFYNEWDDDFPPDLSPEVHHCLVGCLYCQAYCPANKDVPIDVADGPTFDAKETEALLQGASKVSLPPSVIGKLEEFGFLEGFPEVTRNLRLLLETPGNVERGLSFITGDFKKGGADVGR